MKDSNAKQLGNKWEFTVPVRTVSEANQREHWAVRADRVKGQREAMRWGWRAQWTKWPSGFLQCPAGWTVTLTRIAPRELDDDNLRSALKAVRDQVAEELGLASDRDPRLEWHYAQEKGKPREYALRVRIERRGAPEDTRLERGMEGL